MTDALLIGLRSGQILLCTLLACRLTFAMIEYRAQKRSGRITHAPIDVRFAVWSILTFAAAVGLFFAPEHLLRLSQTPGPDALHHALLLTANALNIVSAVIALTGMCSAAGQSNLRKAAAVYSIPAWACLIAALWGGL